MFSFPYIKSIGKVTDDKTCKYSECGDGVVLEPGSDYEAITDFDLGY